MDKTEVAAVLDEIATLLELQGENTFRCLAYSKAARAIGQLEANLADVVRDGGLADIPGIGETLRDKITALVVEGKLPFYDDLKAKTPPGLLLILRLPGMGPKKVKALYDQLAIDDLAKLKAACEADQISGLKGFGKKTQDKILEGLAFVGESSERVRIDKAQLVAGTILEALAKLPGVERLELCGSLRRRRETIKDIDLLAVSRDAAALMSAFVTLPFVRTVVGHGETKSSVVVEAIDVDHKRFRINCDLRVVTAAQFPFALNYFTGSKEHNVAMRQRAIQKGLKLNEYELAGADKSVKAKDEADLYRALGLDYVEPELREDTGELAAATAHRLPKLVELGDLVGTFHNHTTWSDGENSVEEMALAAKKLGLKYLGLADHSPSLTVTNGLSPERVRQQQAEIDAVNAKLKGIHIFKGIECDILADGSLDYDDNTLNSFDYVVASVHSYFNQTEEEMTARICKALRHPRITMLGHATGRILLRRDGYKVDLDRVLKTAAEAGTIVEINASPHRLDLDWVHCKRAKALGVPLVINPDAHATTELANLRFGIDVARRGWLEKGDVFNTRTLADVRKAFDERRAK
jgi:DNA polymerase (family 10)